MRLTLQAASKRCTQTEPLMTLEDVVTGPSVKPTSEWIQEHLDGLEDLASIENPSKLDNVGSPRLPSLHIISLITTPLPTKVRRRLARLPAQHLSPSSAAKAAMLYWTRFSGTKSLRADLASDRRGRQTEVIPERGCVGSGFLPTDRARECETSSTP